MQLRLQHPPIPENAAKLAQIAADAALDVDKIRLDYSPETLADIDRIIGRFHEQRLTQDQIGSTIFLSVAMSVKYSCATMTPYGRCRPIPVFLT